MELARQHNLIVLSDEIYDKILYDGTEHVPTASLADDVLFFTYNGLSKNYRAAGYRSGWMIISGAKHRARDLIEGIEMLSNMRLCANVPAQLAIQTALGATSQLKTWWHRAVACSNNGKPPGTCSMIFQASAV